MLMTDDLVLETGGGAGVDVVLVRVEKVVGVEMSEVRVRVKMGISTLGEGSTGAPGAC